MCSFKVGCFAFHCLSIPSSNARYICLPSEALLSLPSSVAFKNPLLAVGKKGKGQLPRCCFINRPFFLMFACCHSFWVFFLCKCVVCSYWPWLSRITLLLDPPAPSLPYQQRWHWTGIVILAADALHTHLWWRCTGTRIASQSYILCSCFLHFTEDDLTIADQYPPHTHLLWW